MSIVKFTMFERNQLNVNLSNNECSILTIYLLVPSRFKNPKQNSKKRGVGAAMGGRLLLQRNFVFKKV